MKTDTIKFAVRFFAIAIATAGLGSCALFSPRVASTTNERECLARAMYFESNRSSEDGMLAVGTVVMNRVESGKYPRSICGVVGQRVQFAPGVLTKQMNDGGAPRALKVADQVMGGKRYPNMKGVYFFHTAGYTYPYSNMHYVAVAGGNAFYEKRRSPGVQPTDSPVMVAQADMPPPVPAAPEPIAPPARPQMAVATADSGRYARPTAAQPLPVADYRIDESQTDDNFAEALPPIRPLEKPAKRSRAAQTEVAFNDEPPSGRPTRAPEPLPPVRPRGSVGQVRIAPPRVPLPPQPQSPARMTAFNDTKSNGPKFRFEQGPQAIMGASPKQPAAKQQRPRPATTAVARAVPTVRIESVPVEAGMAGGLPLAAPKPPRPVHKTQSSLEPKPLF